MEILQHVFRNPADIYCYETLPFISEEPLLNLSEMPDQQADSTRPAKAETSEVGTRDYCSVSGDTWRSRVTPTRVCPIGQEAGHQRRTLSRSQAFRFPDVPWKLCRSTKCEEQYPVSVQGGPPASPTWDRELERLCGRDPYEEQWPTCACGEWHIGWQVPGHGRHMCRVSPDASISQEEDSRGYIMAEGDEAYASDPDMAAFYSSGEGSPALYDSEMGEQEYYECSQVQAETAMDY